MTDDPAVLLATLRVRLGKLDGAMASGVLTVEDADTGRVTYRSYPEMRQARTDLVTRVRELEADLNPAAPRRTRQIVMTGRTGW